eukprot:8838071-Lingulodinium_polyedra.AAC.1
MFRGAVRAFPGVAYEQAACQLAQDRAAGPRFDKTSPFAAPYVGNANLIAFDNEDGGELYQAVVGELEER